MTQNDANEHIKQDMAREFMEENFKDCVYVDTLVEITAEELGYPLDVAISDLPDWLWDMAAEFIRDD